MKTFVAYVDRYDYCEEMNNDEKANLFDCIRSYTKGCDCIPLDNIKFIWLKIKKMIDADKSKWEYKSKKNRDNANKRWGMQTHAIASEGIPSHYDNDNVNDIIYNKEDIQFNEDEKEIIKTYELGFNKLDDTDYRHKLNLLIQLLTTSGQVSFTNGGLVSYENEEGQIMNKIEKVQVIDYKVAKIKAIEVVSAKERYKVKDFWATLNNRIKKDLSPKKFN